jgi:glycosyltransferase involved in cell wall biosynthesis
MNGAARAWRIGIWHWGRRGGGAKYTYEVARELASREDVKLSLFLSAGVEGRTDYEALPASLWFARTFATIHPSTQKRVMDLLNTAALVLRTPALLPAFVRRVRSQDVVLCTMIHPLNSLVSWAIRWAGARYVVVLHEPTSDRATYASIIRGVTRLEVRRADGVVLLSQAAGQVFSARFGENRLPREVIPLGSFQFGQNRPRRFPTGRPVRLLFFGRIDEYKGLDLLLAAFARLRRDDRPVTLSIVGAGDLSLYRAALTAAPDVRVVNEWVDEAQIGAILDEHDVCVLPYLHSSQSAVVPMAQYAGLPVVTTPVGGLVEQVEHGETGVVAADMTPEAVATAVESLLTPEYYEQLSRGASEYARDRLDWGAIGDELMRFMTRVVGERV